MRIKAVLTLLCGVTMMAVCGFASWRSIRIGRADWIASAGTLDAFERATRLAPDDPRLLARMAIYRNVNDDPSPAVDEELRRAAQMDPFNADVLMTLGLREEFRGNGTEAESYLARAAEIDHQFKPAWTLANYYYRSNQPDKSWPMIRRILNLEPLGFDPTPVFDLCWRLATDNGPAGNQQADKQRGDNQHTDNQVRDSRRVLSLIPKHGHRPIQYLAFLIGSHRTDAALDSWPEALAASDPADSTDTRTLTGFADLLTAADRIPDAVMVWNQLVERGIVHSGPVDPAKGVSIADPDFQFAPLAQAFGWRVADIPGVFASGFSGAVRLEITGEGPESWVALSTFAPVVPDTQYHLVWKIDGSLLSSPEDPGFSFQIVQQPGDAVTQCPPPLAPGAQTTCDFATLAKAGKVRIDFRYSRALGTTRDSGVLRLTNVHLEFAR